ncbi:MAG TPA: sigma-54 dependent transcriptional regulator [Verrucomicrobiae bacterium]|jgi:DNA-binding NtrC family response regulator|nr:sigma-54 dependent transcriptional regulator [Verrucomicrobiae bacterium]
MAKVLLIDDEVTMVQMVTELLRREGHEVLPFSAFKDAVEALESQVPELVITDLYLDKTRTHGLEILQKARALNPPATVIVITAYATIETAVDAMKKGAFDYLEKPFKVDDLRLCVQRALSYNVAISENIYLRKQLKKKYQFSQLIGSSPVIQDVFKMIERVADTDSTILILGESGTGKELVARALHFNSRRQFAPFIPINCSALPENLLESELFGHCKGAFTGAINDKKGLFQEADGGTIFLDEIGSMPPVLQSRLLRVLQEREVRRVGDNIPSSVNVRVLAATNEPLEKRIKEGTFREDLFYRLNVIPITLPSLRERREDVPLLTMHFLRSKINPRSGKLYSITRKTLDVLAVHDWPGNVRELENAIERACALCEDSVIRVADLPPILRRHAPVEGGEDLVESPEDTAEPLGGLAVGTASAPTQASFSEPIGPLKDYLRDQELTYVNRALAQTSGDKEKAAELLGVSVATLYRKLAEDDAARVPA